MIYRRARDGKREKKIELFFCLILFTCSDIVGKLYPDRDRTGQKVKPKRPSFLKLFKPFFHHKRDYNELKNQSLQKSQEDFDYDEISPSPTVARHIVPNGSSNQMSSDSANNNPPALVMPSGNDEVGKMFACIFYS